MNTGKGKKQIELPEPVAVGALLCAGLVPLFLQFEDSVFGALALFTWVFLYVVAILAQSAPASREFVAGTLRKKNFTQIYTFLAKPTLRWFWDGLCDQVADGAGPWATFKAALTWKLYDRALLIAVAYPMLLLVGWWIVTGQDGRLGTTVIIPAAPLWPDRIQTFVVITTTALALPAFRWTAAGQKVLRRKVSGWLALGAMVGAFVIAGVNALTFALAGAYAFAVARAFAPTGAVAVTFTCALSIAGSIAGAFAGVGGVVVEYLDGKNRQRDARVLLTLFLPAVWIVVLRFQPWNDGSDVSRGTFLFLGVLPLINALFDVLSYAVTLTLMRLGLRSKQPMLFGALDLFAALFLFLVLGVALTFVIATMNRIAGVQIFDMGAFFTGIYSDPHAYWWLYAMVFSTILPTALHGILSLLGAQAFVPAMIRRPVAALLRDAPGTPWKSAVAPLAVGTLWLIPFLALGGIGWVFWRVAVRVIEWLGWQYFTALRDFALWIDAF